MRFLVYFYGKLMENICLKAAGNYSASVWINLFLILSLENLQPSIFMISAFLGLVGFLIHGFNIPKIVNTYDIQSNNSLIIRLLMVNCS